MTSYLEIPELHTTIIVTIEPSVASPVKTQTILRPPSTITEDSWDVRSLPLFRNPVPSVRPVTSIASASTNKRQSVIGRASLARENEAGVSWGQEVHILDVNV